MDCRSCRYGDLEKLVGYPGWDEQPTIGKYRTRTQERGKMKIDVIDLFRSVN